MTGEIKVGEVGQPFRISTAGFDMSGSTGLSIKFTAPDGTETTYTQSTTPAVTAPAVALTNDPNLGNQAASTYFELTSIASTFDQSGTWKACARYADATPIDVEIQSELTFVVTASCF